MTLGRLTVCVSYTPAHPHVRFRGEWRQEVEFQACIGEGQPEGMPSMVGTGCMTCVSSPECVDGCVCKVYPAMITVCFSVMAPSEL